MEDKCIRQFYLEQTMRDMSSKNGPSSGRAAIAKLTDKLNSSTSTSSKASKRRIRCRMCRQELADEDHLDHGKLLRENPTPAAETSEVTTEEVAGPDGAASGEPTLADIAQGAATSPLAGLPNSVSGSVASPFRSGRIPMLNPGCSGYFVEPMPWMTPLIDQGNVSGKINCPNKKCNAKLGNYDWAGVACSCQEWVTPAFCLHKSKVDEISSSS